MNRYEAEGRTVEEAINLGLEKLGASISDVDIQVVSEGSKGLFGLFGSRMAKVALTMKQEVNMKDAARALFADALDKPESKGKAATTPAKKKEASSPRKADKVQDASPSHNDAPVSAEPKAKKPEQPRRERKQQAAKEPVLPAEQKDPSTKEGKAQAFLQQLTQLMGVEVSVHVHTDEDGIVRVNIQGDTLGILIGRRGETLDALQYLTSLQVNKGDENYTRVTLDSEGYRAKREEALIRLANRMANRARRTGRRVSMEPMNPYERRILHAALQNAEGVSTHSEGEEPNRHVVITVDRDYDPDKASKEATILDSEETSEKSESVVDDA